MSAMEVKLKKRCRCTLLRHCEELLRRSNPDCIRGKILDCFAALAMTRMMQLYTNSASGDARRENDERTPRHEKAPVGGGRFP